IDRGRARRRNDAARRSHRRSRAARGNSRGRGGGERNAERCPEKSKFRNRAVLEIAPVSSGPWVTPLAARCRKLDRDSWGAREQFEEHRCAFPGGQAFGDYWYLRQRQIHVNARRNPPGGPHESGERTPSACW